jgi:hypothetical protein
MEDECYVPAILEIVYFPVLYASVCYQNYEEKNKCPEELLDAYFLGFMCEAE